MSNQFLISTIKLINRHGVPMSYNSVVVGAYDVNTGSVTDTNTTYSLIMYPKQTRFSPHNFPDLVGKEGVIFYLANNSLAFTPKLSDTITYNSGKYVVQSIQTHTALGQIVLYKIVATKG